MILKKTPSEKACSICGNVFPIVEFSYGNRENRSYCQHCNRGEKKAYRIGGKIAATRYRKEMRAKWVK